MERCKQFLLVFKYLFFTPAMVTVEVKKSFYYVIPRMLRTLEESRASNSKWHLIDVITEIYSEFSENVEESNAVNKNPNLVHRCLYLEKTFGKIDHVLQSDWSLKMAQCESRLVESAIFSPLSKSFTFAGAEMQALQENLS